jgi:hypothetical protein
LAWAWAVKCKTVFTVKTCRFATFILFEVSYFVLRLSVCFHPREEEVKSARMTKKQKELLISVLKSKPYLRWRWQ